MKRFIIQFKGRFGWEDVRIYFNKDDCINSFKVLREKGFRVRVIEVVIQ